MWPWQRHRVERQRARNDRATATAQANAAEAQLRAAERLAEHSRVVTARLRFERDKNGWTDMILDAWGAR